VTTLVLRLVLAPAFIVAISLLARRFGARAGGVVGGLPVIIGPILLVLALDEGRSFASDAAVGGLLGVVALIGFVLGYVLASRRFAWPVSIAVGWAVFFALVGALRPVHVGPVVGFACACGACLLGVLLLPSPGRAIAAADYRHPRYDLAFRAACAAVPVVVITGLAGVFGPHVAGLLASFPVITPVVAAFTHAQRGAREAERLLYGFTVGFLAYAVFCFFVAVALERLGTPVTFLLGALLALATQTVSLTTTWRSARRAAV
jgi:hypothetical protein